MEWQNQGWGVLLSALMVKYGWSSVQLTQEDLDRAQPFDIDITETGELKSFLVTPDDEPVQENPRERGDDDGVEYGDPRGEW